MDICLAENQVEFLTDSFDRHLLIPIRTWLSNMDNEWEVQKVLLTIDKNSKDILYQDKYQMIVLIPRVR